MYKMFERYGWVEYDARTGRLLSKRLKIEDLKRIFPDMPLLDVSPVVLPKRSQRWPLGFGALRGVLDGARAGPRRAFLGHSVWAAA